MTTGQFLFGFDGRISRSNWWLIYGLLCLSFFMFAIPIIAQIVGSTIALSLSNFLGVGEFGGKASSTILVGGFLFMLYLIAGFVVWLAATVKRLHDRDMDGIWVLLFGCGPWIATFLAIVFSMEHEVVLAMLFSATNFVIQFWALVALGCLRGTVGDNRFGADPLLATAAAPVRAAAYSAPAREPAAASPGAQIMAAIRTVAAVDLAGVGEWSSYCLSVTTSELVATPGGLTIGRDPANAVFLIEDEKISRIHARLIYSDNAVFIEDADSANGTEVNGRRVAARERRALRTGDRVKFGPATFVVTLK